VHDGSVARLRAVGPYERSLRAIVHALKYEKRKSLARPLGARLAEAGADLLADADALVPVPLHPWRQWRRGFNQAAALAAELCRARAASHRQAPPVWSALERRRATRPQTGLDGFTRRTNVQEAFAVAGWTRSRRGRWLRLIRGRVLLLIDDVSTTGATLEECAKVLHAAGAREVRALVVARVPTTPASTR